MRKNKINHKAWIKFSLYKDPFNKGEHNPHYCYTLNNKLLILTTCSNVSDFVKFKLLKGSVLEKISKKIRATTNSYLIVKELDKIGCSLRSVKEIYVKRELIETFL